MDAVLIFPPHCDMRSPQLAIPALQAAIRASAFSSVAIDANLEAFLFLTQKDRLLESARSLSTKFGRAINLEARNQLGMLLRSADYVVENFNGAVEALRSESFFDPFKHHNAREIINTGLRMISASKGAVNYSIGPIDYSVSGYDPTRPRDLSELCKKESIDIFADYYNNVLIPNIAKCGPLTVGVTLTNQQQLIPGLSLCRRLRQHGFHVVAGGALLTKFADKLLDMPEFFKEFFSIAVVYEGETALAEIITCLKSGKPPRGIPNSIVLDGTGGVTSPRLHVEDLRRLPTPDFDGLPLHKYLTPEPVLPIYFGKGCYFNKCKFCEIPYINHISSKPYRTRLSEQVASDVDNLNAKYGARYFLITDEALPSTLLLRASAHSANWAKFNPRFSAYSRFEKGLTPERCSALYRAGLRKVFFGLESGSAKIMRATNKEHDLSVVVQVLRNCDTSGLAYHVFSIVGFPEETEIDARETLNFFLENSALFSHPRHSFDIHGFSLDVRTKYVQDADLHGIVIDENALEERPFSIEVPVWFNKRGLSHASAEQLIRSFRVPLSAAFKGSRMYPAHLWPSFEEYSILYMERYPADFPFLSALPTALDSIGFTLEVPNEVSRFEEGDGTSLETFMGEADVHSITSLYLAQRAEHHFHSLGDLQSEIGVFISGSTDILPPPALLRRIEEDLNVLIQSGLLNCRIGPNCTSDNGIALSAKVELT